MLDYYKLNNRLDKYTYKLKYYINFTVFTVKVYTRMIY